MDLLIVGAVVVPVAVNGVIEEDVHEVGARIETFNGAERSSVRGRKRRWSVTTRAMLPADAAELRAELEKRSFAVTGRLFTGSCSAVIRRVSLRYADRQVFEFQLRER